MKYLITIILAFSIQFSNAQMSGIPEQDSLLELKDKLFLMCNEQMRNDDPNYHSTFEMLLWVKYQWIQWVNGEKVLRKCRFSENPKKGFNELGYILMYNDPLSPYSCNGDTLVKIPKPISYEGFMNWRIENAINK